jgi:zinc protease
LFNFVELGSISVTAADDRWQDVVPVIEKEFRRAMEHGFTEAELAEAKSNLLNAYEQQVKQKATRKSEGIATVLAQTINDKSGLLRSRYRSGDRKTKPGYHRPSRLP